jgi:hypothetical protein
MDTAAVVDACARVIADAVSGHVFAAGVTAAVTDAAPEVVPLADDFAEAGLPAVTCAMGQWTPTLQPGNERIRMTVHGVVWRRRVPLGENATALYGDRDAIAAAWIAHTKAYGPSMGMGDVQSAVLTGGPGIVPRTLAGLAAYLTLPFTVEVVTGRIVVPQPA